MSNSSYLIHYGVLGMKWGVRRYQNKDGSLTPAGKKRAKARDDLDKRLEYVANTSKVEALEKRWRNDRNTEYEFEDWISDKHLDSEYSAARKWDKSHGMSTQEINRLMRDRDALDDSYIKRQTALGAGISALVLAPIAMRSTSFITNLAQVEGKKRAAIILGSGLATVAGVSTLSFTSSKSEQKRVETKYGIRD